MDVSDSDFANQDDSAEDEDSSAVTLENDYEYFETDFTEWIVSLMSDKTPNSSLIASAATFAINETSIYYSVDFSDQTSDSSFGSFAQFIMRNDT